MALITIPMAQPAQRHIRDLVLSVPSIPDPRPLNEAKALMNNSSNDP
jgi:hypothetical protein